VVVEELVDLRQDNLLMVPLDLEDQVVEDKLKRQHHMQGDQELQDKVIQVDHVLQLHQKQRVAVAVQAQRVVMLIQQLLQEQQVVVVRVFQHLLLVPLLFMRAVRVVVDLPLKILLRD
jgi:hypothetical protein